MRVFAVSVIFLLSIFGASAQSGNELSQQCQTNKLLIAGYVAGALDKAAVDSDVLIQFFLDTYDVRKTAERIEKDNRTLVASSFAIDGYCVPKETTVEQKAGVFCKYLLDNPSQRSKNAAALLVSAVSVIAQVIDKASK
jgi:hypothetical protein